MDRDGSNKRQVTRLGAASFAPFFHPDGKRILFSSNHPDPRGRNFDLWLVNDDGTGLERVTSDPTFDGFPMFSPDGKTPGLRVEPRGQGPRRDEPLPGRLDRNARAMTAPEPHAFLFAEGRFARFLSFTRPVRVLEARRPDEVSSVLRAVDEALLEGRFVAGYLAYEAAAAFGLRVREAPRRTCPSRGSGSTARRRPWRSTSRPRPAPCPRPGSAWTRPRYARAVARIQELIARGDTYQVNFTFPLETDLGEDPWRLFQRLVAVQPVPYAAYLDLGRFVLASASPELFFEREGPRLRTRPMKGTAPRGKDLEDDARKAEALRASAKDRAENLMIVDMLRNDLGRVAETGSVRVPALFEVERHPDPPPDDLERSRRAARPRSRGSSKPSSPARPSPGRPR